MPFPGWTLPGVYTLGGAQIALKSQGCAIGRRCVFVGTGPLLYLVAYQYAKAGAEVAAVLDTAPSRQGALPGPARAAAQRRHVRQGPLLPRLAARAAASRSGSGVQPIAIRGRASA